MKKVDNNEYKIIYLRQLKQIYNSNCKNKFSTKTFKDKVKNTNTKGLASRQVPHSN